VRSKDSASNQVFIRMAVVGALPSAASLDESAHGRERGLLYPAALAFIADYHRCRTRSLATGIHLSGIYAGVAAYPLPSGRTAAPRHRSRHHQFLQLLRRRDRSLPRRLAQRKACGLESPAHGFCGRIASERAFTSFGETGQERVGKESARVSSAASAAHRLD
jgi:hypothetical protein